MFWLRTKKNIFLLCTLKGLGALQKFTKYTNQRPHKSEDKFGHFGPLNTPELSMPNDQETIFT